MITLAFTALIGIVAMIVLGALVVVLNYILDAISVRFGDGPAIAAAMVLIVSGIIAFAYPLAASITK